jgi:pyruvate/2-oxoglutarate dehydrogenase complex dihydrolipoamide dehydrogenase (E3) component
MTDEATFDILIIGGGQAGPPLAHGLAATGRRVALVERRDLGGSCINFGCTPTKAAIACARVAHLARRAGEFGLRIPSVEVDFPAVMERARQIARRSREGLDAWFSESENPTLLRGHARLDGRAGPGFRVRIGERAVIAEQVVLDTGTRTRVPAISGIDTVQFMHAGNWLELNELPADLGVIGAGAIGLEMAQFYRRMGSRVTVIETSGQIAGHEDTDVATALQGYLETEGIAFRLNSPVARIVARPGGATLSLGADAGTQLAVSHIFIAAGRQPNTDDLGLETVGVATAPGGLVTVDKRLSTSVAGIWAAGDIRGGPQFTHTAWDDHRILLSQIVGDGARTSERVVPYAIFTDPELGRVGMTEAAARGDGRAVKAGRFELKRNGKATEIGEGNGFIKIIADAQSRRILGASVLGADAAELVHSCIVAMNAKAPYTVIADAVFIHPTLSEAVQSATAAIA